MHNASVKVKVKYELVGTSSTQHALPKIVIKKKQ